MVTHHPKDGGPPSKTYQKELYYRMVTNHPKDGHPPFQIYQREVYYRLGIWHINITHKIKTS